VNTAFKYGYISTILNREYTCKPLQGATREIRKKYLSDKDKKEIERRKASRGMKAHRGHREENIY